MILEYVTGCICDSLTIDDVETVDMEVNELRSKVIRFLNEVDDIATLQDILIDIAESAGEFENLGRCEQCGDSIYKHTLEIKDDKPCQK